MALLTMTGPRLRLARHEEARVHGRVRVRLDAVESAAVRLHERRVAAGAHDVRVERVVLTSDDLGSGRSAVGSVGSVGSVGLGGLATVARAAAPRP